MPVILFENQTNFHVFVYRESKQVDKSLSKKVVFEIYLHNCANVKNKRD